MRSFLLAFFVALSVFSAQSDTVYELLVKDNFTDIVTFLDSASGTAFKTQLNNTAVSSTVFAAKGAVDEANFGYYIVNSLVAQADFKKGLVVETNLQISAGFFQRAMFNSSTEIMGATISKYETADNGALVTVDQALVPPTNTIVDIAKSGAKALAALIEQANITLPAFATVFAPNDDAWEKSDNAKVQYLNSGKASAAELATVITFHASGDLYYSAQGPAAITTLDAGLTEQVTVTNGTAKYGDGAIIAADILASDGVVHLIDTVQLPSNFRFTVLEWLAGQDDYKNFYQAVSTTTNAAILACVDANASCTVLAPNDDEFKNANVSDAELQYYFIQGVFDLENEDGALPSLLPLVDTHQRIFVMNEKDGNDTKIVVGNEEEKATATRAGFNPPVLPAETALYTIDHDLEAPDDSVAELVKDNDDLSTLYTLVGLVDKNGTFSKTVLADDAKNFTVFAPVDPAFCALPAPYVNLLTKDTKKLESVLDAHVVEGIYFASDIIAAAPITLTTIAGVQLSVTYDANSSVVSISVVGSSSPPAEVVATDFLADNGVAHAINSVLVPADFTVDNLELLEGMNATTFIGYLSTADLLDSNKTNYNLTTGEFVFFAPNDYAFDHSDKSLFDTNDTKALQSVLLRHVVSAPAFNASNPKPFTIVNNTCYKTLSQENLCTYTADFKTWEVYLDSNGTEYRHEIRGFPVANGSTSLQPWSTLPFGASSSYGVEVDGILGEKSKDSKKGLGSTEIGLIVAGCIVAVLLAGAAVGGAVWYYRKNSNKDYEEI